MPETRRTVQIQPETLSRLRDLADDGQSMNDVIARLIDVEAAQRFWGEFNAGYAEMRANPEVWAEEESERALWDTTLRDGLKDE